MHPYTGQPSIRFWPPADLGEHLHANNRNISHLNSRLTDLEAWGKKCEKSQQETQSTASQYAKYFEERINDLERRVQRLGNLERMQQFEQFIEDIQERVAANKKPLDDVEAKAAGNGLKIEGIMREITAYKKTLDTVVVLVSDLVDSGEKPNTELVLRRSPRRKKVKVVG